MDLQKSTRKQLIDLCKENGIKGYSSKNKNELIECLTKTNNVVSDSKDIIKPFLKWVGGKTQIIEDVINSFPASFENYYEPFLGGGSVLLALLCFLKQGRIQIKGKIYASDLNPNIINLFKNIQNNCDQVVNELKKIVKEYNSCREDETTRTPENIEEAMASKESYYYWIRIRFNSMKKEEKNSPLASAMLIFINKTCFRGVYREGPNGINVPYGNYKNPSVFDENHLKQVSELIKDVVFTCSSFQKTLEKVKENDFVYLDPPYAPENSKSFVGYTADGFKIEQHKELFNLINNIVQKKVNILMSNADVDLVKQAFQAPTFTTKTLVCRRAINSKNPEAITNEVLIKSY